MVGSGQGKEESDTIWGMLGIDDEAKADEYMSLLRSSATEIVNVLDYVYQKRVDDANRNYQLINDNLYYAQQALEVELALMEKGYASNVDLKKMEVEQLMAQREKALQSQQQAVLRQLKLESLAQAISLTSSAAHIIYEAIKEYGLYGLIIAGLEIAGLWVAWDSYKQTAKNVTQLAEGGSGTSTGMITGKSHAEGGEHFLDHVEVEGGEKWGVLSKRASGKYGEMFDYMVDSFNKDRVPDVFPQVASVVNVDNNGFKELTF